jgi:hypothetical protein
MQMIQFIRKFADYIYSILEWLFGFKNPLPIVPIFLKLAGPGIKTIRQRKTRLQFQVRGARNVWSIVDIGAGSREETIFSPDLSMLTRVVFGRCEKKENLIYG